MLVRTVYVTYKDFSRLTIYASQVERFDQVLVIRKAYDSSDIYLSLANPNIVRVRIFEKKEMSEETLRGREDSPSE